MDDGRIIELFFERSEDAIKETALKYGRYCHTVAFRILASDEDAEECVNDTYLRLWNAIPPARPDSLSAYIARITRNLALDRYAKEHAQKRCGEVPLALDELAECLPDNETPDSLLDGQELSEALRAFIAALPLREKTLFLRRYFYLLSVKDACHGLGMTEANAKVILHRVKKRLAKYLAERGVAL